MNRKEFENYLTSAYKVTAEYPWIKYPTFAVYRHNSNKKWFAVIMTISKRKLGVNSDELIDVVNLKCDEIILNSALSEVGFYPAYHMNKRHWVTIALDDSASTENLKLFLDVSYELTKNLKK